MLINDAQKYATNKAINLAQAGNLSCQFFEAFTKLSGNQRVAWGGALGRGVALKAGA